MAVLTLCPFRFGATQAPQIYKIVAAGDVSGISASAFYFDAFGYLITPVYGYLEGFPFSTYGESFPIGIQNFVLVLLFWVRAFFDDRSIACPEHIQRGAA
jgi:uncharacterized protein with PQ loop repeat